VSDMKRGVIFPQLEIGRDLGVIREYARAANDLGYDYLLAYDHVLGANRASRPDWRPEAYDSGSMFHEPFTLLSWLAEVAPKLELVTGVIVLPQRQTVLVAKQAAQISLLTGGKFRLGVGVGWNAVEYEALGEPFGNRGRRIDEQIELLRRLWTDPHVTFNGAYDTVTDAGLNPLPDESIPIWIGGLSDAAIARVGRLGDGWLPLGEPDAENAERIERFRQIAAEGGRDVDAIGIDAQLSYARTSPDHWGDIVDGWRNLGATHLAVDTMSAGFRGAEHIETIRNFREATG
jgi:probable F420-dependent oxidoreductase